MCIVTVLSRYIEDLFIFIAPKEGETKIQHNTNVKQFKIVETLNSLIMSTVG